MARDKAMSLSAFQTNLKNRYEEDGELDVEARIDSLTRAIVLQNKEENPFIFSELLNMIDAQDIHLDDLVSSDGSVQDTHLNEIIKVSKIEWEKEQAEEQARQEQENAKDPFLESMLVNEKLKEQEVKDRISKIDFTKPLSMDDYLYIAENRNIAWRNLSTEQKVEYTKETYAGLETKKAQELLNDEIEAIRSGKEQEELKVSKENSPEKNEFIQKMIREVNGKQKINRMFLGERLSQTKLELSRYFDDYLEKNDIVSAKEFLKGYLCPEDVKIMLEYVDSSPEKFICNFMLHSIERKQKFSTSKKFEVLAEGFQEILDDIKNVQNKEDNKSQFSLDTESFFDAQFDKPENEYYREPVKEAENRGEVPGENHVFEPKGNFAAFQQDTLRPDGQPKQTIENLNSNINSKQQSPAMEYTSEQAENSEQSKNQEQRQSAQQPDRENKMQVHESKREYTIQQNTNETIQAIEAKEDIKDNETPEYQTEVKTWLEKMKESKNPFISKVAQRIMAFRDKDRKALAAPKQQEGALKDQSFDSTQNARMDITDRDFMPTGKGLRNSLIGLGEGVMNGLGSLFNGNKKESKNPPAKTIVPLTSSDFDSRIAVSKEELNNGEGPKIIIPNNVKTTENAKKLAELAKATKDEGFTH